MGKVYDALQRAEQERARRASEAVSAPPAEVLLPDPRVSPRPAEARTPDVRPPAVPRGASPRRSRVAALFSRIRSRFAFEANDPNKLRIALLQPESVVAEQFRSLRARIDSLAADRPVRTLGITSALDGDGKTMAAVNLALVMSMDVERRVLLVDCDMRSPKVAESLRLRVGAGLAEVLRGDVELEEAIHGVEGARLSVLPVRSVPANPSELLASSRMREVLEKLANQYDAIVLDLPPTLGLPDAKIVSGLCDGIVFVVRADVTPEEDVRSALEVLDINRVIGMVLNGAEGVAAAYGA